MAIIAINMKLPLPVVWGVAVSLVLTILVSLATCKGNAKRDLLPGFSDSGQKIDRQVFTACMLGASGSLIFSIGVGMWINWICIFIGAAAMYFCVRILDRAFSEYQLSV